MLICGLCAYVALLDFVAMTDDAYRYASSESLLGFHDFATDMEAPEVYVGENRMVFIGAEPGVKKCTAELVLKDYKQIDVTFKADCAEQFAGTVVHVDLCGEDYDREEQEFTWVLQAGKNTVSGSILIGEDAPEQVQFRIFTLDATQFDVQELSVTTQVEKDLTVRKAVASVIMLSSAVVSLFSFVVAKTMKKRK